jgi:hypothetical protein
VEAAGEVVPEVVSAVAVATASAGRDPLSSTAPPNAFFAMRWEAAAIAAPTPGSARWSTAVCRYGEVKLPLITFLHTRAAHEHTRTRYSTRKADTTVHASSDQNVWGQEAMLTKMQLDQALDRARSRETKA